MKLFLSRTCIDSLYTARPCWKKDYDVEVVWLEDGEYSSPIKITRTPTLIDGPTISVGRKAVDDYLEFKGA